MYKHILVPIALDHNPHEAEAMQIADILLDKDGKITVLNVVEDMPGYVDMHISEEIKTRNYEAAKEAVDKIAADHPKAKGAVIHGHAANAILAHAEDTDCDCIVIASHKPGLQDYFIGSTAARVVRHAKCSVHVVR